jgi:hypothetical protein
MQYAPSWSTLPLSATKPPPLLLGTVAGAVRVVSWTGRVGPRVTISVGGVLRTDLNSTAVPVDTSLPPPGTAILGLHGCRDLDVLVARYRDGSVGVYSLEGVLVPPRCHNQIYCLCNRHDFHSLRVHLFSLYASR